MVFLVNRTYLQRTRILDGEFPACIPYPVVVVLGGIAGENGVTIGEVEDHDIPSADLAETLQTAVIILDESRI